MGFLSKVSNAVFGKSNGPKYNIDQASKMGQYGVSSSIGNMSIVKNADGTYSKNYTTTGNDATRNKLMSQALGNLDMSSASLADPTANYKPTQLYGNINQQTADNAAQSYYDQATRLLNQNFDREKRTADTNLINRGIQVGTDQYNQVMGDLQDRQNATLNDLANQSVFQGQNLLGTMLGNQAQQTANEGGVFSNQAQLLQNQGLGLGNVGQYYSNQGQQISNANSLGAGRDVYGVAALGGNNEAYENAYNAAQYNYQNQANKNQQLLNAGIGAAAMMLSDKRLKENLHKVGALDNGLNVYVGNYKPETGLDTRPQLFLLAQEVKKKHPEAVASDKLGMLAVDYKQAVKEKK